VLEHEPDYQESSGAIQGRIRRRKVHGISLSPYPRTDIAPLFSEHRSMVEGKLEEKAEENLSTTSSRNSLSLSILIRSDSVVKRASILQAFSVLVRETAGYLPRFREVNPHLC